MLYISIGIFLISLTQRTYCTANDCGYLGSGFICLITGWLGVLAGGANLCWLANPVLITAWITSQRHPLFSIILCGLSTLLSLSFLFFHKILIDEAGNYAPITGYKMGYWLWTLSSVSFFVGMLWTKFTGD